MAVSLDQIYSALMSGVQAVGNLTRTLENTFLQQGTVVSSAIATSGSTITFTSSQAGGFLSVTTSSGAAYYIPIYR